jgi:hypothetical protein
MKEPEGEGPPRPSLRLIPLAEDPKGKRSRRRADRRRREESDPGDGAEGTPRDRGPVKPPQSG